MSTQSDGDADLPTGRTPSVEPLSNRERLAATAIGIVSGGGGAYAVFASTNQAGTAILLILSAIFLLIGIQGTSLIRFSTGTNTVELERRKRIVEQEVLKVVANEEDIAKAEGVVEGVAIANPSLPPLRIAESRLYVRRLELTIAESGYYSERLSFDFGPDLMIHNYPLDGTVAVYVKHSAQSKILGAVLMNLLKRVERSPLPVLAVSNAQFPSSAVEHLARGSRRFVTWRDSRDNDVLRAGLSELFSEIPSRSLPGEA